jgi:CheY-like chemotaxis protein
VLVVDDDREVRELLVDLLAGEGYQVSSAGDGQEALFKIVVHWPDLILLDLMMPIMNGWQFLKVQSEHPMLARIPVIVISAFDNALAVAAILPKPLLVEDVLETVRRLAGRAGRGILPAPSVDHVPRRNMRGDAGAHSDGDREQMLPLHLVGPWVNPGRGANPKGTKRR